MMLSASKVLFFLILPHLLCHSVSNERPKLFTDQLLKFNKKTGDAVLLSCKIQSGSLPVKFEWFKDNVPVQTSKRILMDSSQRRSDLELNSLESSDTGNYLCRVSNEFGSDTLTTDLNVQGPPRWTVKPTDIRSNPRETITIKCDGIAYPLPKIVWRRKKDSEWLDLSDSSTSFVISSENEITARNVEKEKDEGKYACEISNEISPNLWAEFEVKVSDGSDSCLVKHCRASFSMTTSDDKMKKFQFQMAQQTPYPPANPPPYPYPEQPYSPGFKGEPDIPAPEPHDIVFGEEPICVRCPHCNLAVESKIDPETGKVTWLSSIGCFILGGLLCFWLPFCWKCTRDVKHTCPRCNHELGFYRRC